MLKAAVHSWRSAAPYFAASDAQAADFGHITFYGGLVPKRLEPGARSWVGPRCHRCLRPYCACMRVRLPEKIRVIVHSPFCSETE